MELQAAQRCTMGKAGKKKRSAAKKTAPTAPPLVDATVFDGAYALQVPSGWMHPAEVLATGVDIRPSEQFVSRRAFTGAAFATLEVDVPDPRTVHYAPPSGRQRLMEFLRFQEAENDATFTQEPDIISFALQPPFVRGWFLPYSSVGNTSGRTTETVATLFESPEADVILRLNNGATENVDFPQIAKSLRSGPRAPPPEPVTSKPQFHIDLPMAVVEELLAIAKGRDNLDADILVLVTQAMCSSEAQKESLDGEERETVNIMLESTEFAPCRQAALEIPAVKRRVEDVQQRARVDAAAVAKAELEEAMSALSKHNAQLRAKGPSQAASESVDDPRARRIAVAAAVCEAAVKAILPHERMSDNARFTRAVENLRDAIVTDKDDGENFTEYCKQQLFHHARGNNVEIVVEQRTTASRPRRSCANYLLMKKGIRKRCLSRIL